MTVENHPVPEAIDLGLPSGLKWASFNLGATKPEEYGDYYAWGETEPYYSSQDPLILKEGKDRGYDSSSYTKGGKYNSSDSKSVLDLEDDAAFVNLGGNWRMPTNEEWKELVDNCIWTWTQVNGVYGRRVTSNKTGNSIFLPAAGIRHGTDLVEPFISGICWSSSLDMEYSPRAWRLYFTEGGLGRNRDSRYRGLSVRPVCD